MNGPHRPLEGVEGVDEHPLLRRREPVHALAPVGDRLGDDPHRGSLDPRRHRRGLHHASGQHRLGRSSIARQPVHHRLCAHRSFLLGVKGFGLGRRPSRRRPAPRGGHRRLGIDRPRAEARAVRLGVAGGPPARGDEQRPRLLGVEPERQHRLEHQRHRARHAGGGHARAALDRELVEHPPAIHPAGGAGGPDCPSGRAQVRLGPPVARRADAAEGEQPRRRGVGVVGADGDRAPPIADGVGGGPRRGHVRHEPGLRADVVPLDPCVERAPGDRLPMQPGGPQAQRGVRPEEHVDVVVPVVGIFPAVEHGGDDALAVAHDHVLAQPRPGDRRAAGVDQLHRQGVLRRVPDLHLGDRGVPRGTRPPEVDLAGGGDRPGAVHPGVEVVPGAHHHRPPVALLEQRIEPLLHQGGAVVGTSVLSEAEVQHHRPLARAVEDIPGSLQHPDRIPQGVGTAGVLPPEVNEDQLRPRRHPRPGAGHAPVSGGDVQHVGAVGAHSIHVHLEWVVAQGLVRIRRSQRAVDLLGGELAPVAEGLGALGGPPAPLVPEEGDAGGSIAAAEVPVDEVHAPIGHRHHHPGPLEVLPLAAKGRGGWERRRHGGRVRPQPAGDLEAAHVPVRAHPGHVGERHPAGHHRAEPGHHPKPLDRERRVHQPGGHRELLPGPLSGDALREQRSGPLQERLLESRVVLHRRARRGRPDSAGPLQPSSLDPNRPSLPLGPSAVEAPVQSTGPRIKCGGAPRAARGVRGRRWKGENAPPAAPGSGTPSGARG